MMRPEQQFENHWPGPEAPDGSSFQTTSPENTPGTSRRGQEPLPRHAWKESARPPSTWVVILRAHELYSATMAVFHEDELHDCVFCAKSESKQLQQQGPALMPCPPPAKQAQVAPGTPARWAGAS
uniref:Uncharacterized protein n=1 Tax=Myotis myotis TaxID=51298 RepID=A0A7J7XH65_MYOMY|nr:hypothetical protein mMyoMyo1_011601 [Myotis myotis]